MLSKTVEQLRSTMLDRGDQLLNSKRSERSLKATDAIQLACAASADVDLFVTNDERRQNKHVDGIQFIVPLAKVPI